MRVAIIGQGYVGLTIAAGSISAGYKVIGIDKSENTVSSLNKGISHIEGISDGLIKSGIDSGKYRASTNFSEIQSAQVVIIAVPTPLDADGKPDISILESAVDSITPYLAEGALVINESTSYIGTLREVIAEPINAKNPKVEDFAVSPERVDPGNLLFGVKNTPRLVGGINERATSRAYEFYKNFCDHVVKVSSPEVAEAAKLLENTFRFVNIGFINEFTKIMNSMNIPTSEVISAATTKPYGFMPFFPNVGIGGHCIPVDPLYLQKNATDFSLASSFIEISEDLNEVMPLYSVNRLEKLYGSLNGTHVLLIGVSYKPNISDTRESPAESVIHHLQEKGAKVSWHDPLVFSFSGQISSPINGDYDLALVLVKHQVLDMSSWSSKPIFCVNYDPLEPNWIPILGSRNYK